jgi:hypothetical protein
MCGRYYRRSDKQRIVVESVERKNRIVGFGIGAIKDLVPDEVESIDIT